MKKLFIVLTISAMATGVLAQAKNDSLPKKGSYLHYGQPAIEDNSMLIEEAFNQESGVIQHISNLMIDKGNVVYSYTQEIPLANDRHQLSFTFMYNSFKRPSGSPDNRFKSQGFGDMLINYRPLIWGKKDWALVIPRFTLIIPTGDARYGFGDGAWGGQFNLAVTKRLNKIVTTHYNAGYTWLSGAHFYSTINNQPELLQRNDMSGFNWGSSAIFNVTPKFNFMVEYVSALQDEYTEEGAVQRKNASYVINPGFRFAIDVDRLQIVPGLGIPLNFADGKYQGASTFFYLSIEPAF